MSILGFLIIVTFSTVGLAIGEMWVDAPNVTYFVLGLICAFVVRDFGMKPLKYIYVGKHVDDYGQVQLDFGGRIKYSINRSMAIILINHLGQVFNLEVKEEE